MGGVSLGAKRKVSQPFQPPPADLWRCTLVICEGWRGTVDRQSPSRAQLRDTVHTRLRNAPRPCYINHQLRLDKFENTNGLE